LLLRYSLRIIPKPKTPGKDWILPQAENFGELNGNYSRDEENYSIS
jgi:hypothetical protein